MDEPKPLTDEELKRIEFSCFWEYKESEPTVDLLRTLAPDVLRLVAEVRQLRPAAKPLEELIAELGKMATNDHYLDCGCWSRVEDALKTYKEASEDVTKPR